jgi:hypothetical protein
MEFKFTPHAIEEMEERGIPLQIVLTVLNNPEQITSEQNDRKAHQPEVTINNKQLGLTQSAS